MSIFVKESIGCGRGVFAGKDFEIGEQIELAPVVELSLLDRLPLRLTKMQYYTFLWGVNCNESLCVVLGYGSIYNHSDKANAQFETDVPKKLMRYFAIKPIKCGDEITIAYGVPLWFTPVTI